MPVITVSGQIGAGAREVARLAAERLGLGYIDHEILAEAAATLGVPMESVASLDERTLGFGERLASMMRRFLEQSAAAGSGDPLVGGVGLDVVLGRTYAEATAEGPHEVPPDKYLATMKAVIEQVGKHGDVVIVGRGSQVILKDLPNTLHALMIAPVEQRIDDTAEREGLSHDAAVKRVHEVDKGRATFHRKFFKVEVDDPALYHLTLNTGLLSLEQAAQAIADSARRLTA
jgi:cytidylate kinase